MALHISSMPRVALRAAVSGNTKGLAHENFADDRFVPVNATVQLRLSRGALRQVQSYRPADNLGTPQKIRCELSCECTVQTFSSCC